MSANTEPPCQYLAWDSAHFGQRLGRVTAVPHTSDTMQSIEAWANQHQIAGLYLLLDTDQHQAIRVAEAHQFHLADLRLTMFCSRLPTTAPAETATAVRLRLSHTADIPALQAMAATLHQNTRFFRDPHFARSASQALYAAWIENSCQGQADAVWVAEEQPGQPLGYLSCHLSAAKMGNIGLVGVAPEAQGKGIGRLLLQRALYWFASQGATAVDVVTQGDNLVAQRLYQRHGFFSHRMQLWYHRWFT